MAPRQQQMCSPCETGIRTGPNGNQYMDLDGHTNAQGGRPNERHGYQGGWTHGVTVLAGGVPHDVRPPLDSANHGTVLYTSAALHERMQQDGPAIKSGTPDERQGVIGKQAHRTAAAGASQDMKPELNHGTVLATFPNLKPNMTWEAQTNESGGRPTERKGSRGGFTAGKAIRSGGAARDVAPGAATVNHGVVLSICPHLAPDMSQECMVKPGTECERQGRVGSFQHGDAHLYMPTMAEAELWQEAGQKGGRRYAPGHYLAGTSIMTGAVPTYTAVH